MPSICIQNLTKNHAAYISRMNKLGCTGLTPRQVHFLAIWAPNASSVPSFASASLLHERFTWQSFEPTALIWRNAMGKTPQCPCANCANKFYESDMNLSDFNLIYNNKSAEAGPFYLCKFSLAFKSQAELQRTTEGFGGIFWVYVSPPFWAIFIYCLAKSLG